MSDWYDTYQTHASSDWATTQLNPEFADIADDVAASGEQVSNADLLEDMIGPNADYDYRGAWKAGISPQSYEYDSRQHWPSSTENGQMLKSPQHPTAWMEYFMRETGEDPNSLGLRNPDEAREYTRSARRKEAK